jgi:hypothetical protein
VGVEDSRTVVLADPAGYDMVVQYVKVRVFFDRLE